MAVTEKHVGSPTNFHKNELRNALLHPSPSAPSSPGVGQVWTDTSASPAVPKVWDGTQWAVLGSTYTNEMAQDAVGGIVTSTNSITATYNDGANTITHDVRRKSTGLTSSQGTIGEDANGLYVDLAIGSANKAMSADARLDQLNAPTGSLSLNSQKITNLGAPSADTDAATYGVVKSLINGRSPKTAVRGATISNVALSGAITHEGITYVTGERILVKAQNNAYENGIYDVNTSGAWTRSADADAWDELVSASVFISEGTTLKDQQWTCTVDKGGTLGVTSVTWTQTGGAAGYGAGAGLAVNVSNLDVQTDGSTTQINGSNQVIVKDGGITLAKMATLAANKVIGSVGGGTPAALDATTTGLAVLGAASAAAARTTLSAVGMYATTIGDGVTTTFTLTHNLNTMDVMFVARYASGTYEAWDVAWRPLTVNTLEVTFATAPAASEIRAVVFG